MSKSRKNICFRGHMGTEKSKGFHYNNFLKKKSAEISSEFSLCCTNAPHLHVKKKRQKKRYICFWHTGVDFEKMVRFNWNSVFPSSLHYSNCWDLLENAALLVRTLLKCEKNSAFHFIISPPGGRGIFFKRELSCSRFYRLQIFSRYFYYCDASLL